MKNVGGMWLPDSDEHFAKKYAVGGHYHQEDFIPLILPYTKGLRVAFDIGAHVGYLTKEMLKYFGHVVSWEPVSENFECLRKNVESPGCDARGWALASTPGYIGLHNPATVNSGAWQKGKSIIVWAGSLDTEALSVKPDFVKIDVQGMEEDVLLGGRILFLTAKPLILVEARKDSGVGAILSEWGAKMVAHTSDDQLWLWR